MDPTTSQLLLKGQLLLCEKLLRNLPLNELKITFRKKLLFNLLLLSNFVAYLYANISSSVQGITIIIIIKYLIKLLLRW